MGWESSTTSSGTTVGSGGELTVTGSDVVADITVEAGGVLQVGSSWPVAGFVAFYAGSVSDVTVSSGGEAVLYEGSLASGMVEAGGVLSLVSGEVSDVTVMSGGTLASDLPVTGDETLTASGLVATQARTLDGLTLSWNETITDSGIVGSGSLAFDGVILSSGAVEQVQGATVYGGGILRLPGSAVSFDDLQIAAGGAVYLDSAILAIPASVMVAGDLIGPGVLSGRAYAISPNIFAPNYDSRTQVVDEGLIMGVTIEGAVRLASEAATVLTTIGSGATE